MVVMPVIDRPAAMTIAPSSTLTSPARKKSVFFQPSRLLPSKRTIGLSGVFSAWSAPGSTSASRGPPSRGNLDAARTGRIGVRSSLVTPCVFGVIRMRLCDCRLRSSPEGDSANHFFCRELLHALAIDLGHVNVAVRVEAGGVRQEELPGFGPLLAPMGQGFPLGIQDGDAIGPAIGDEEAAVPGQAEPKRRPPSVQLARNLPSGSKIWTRSFSRSPT